MKNPVLRLWVGPMFGSKTTQLIAAVDRYRLQSKKVLAFKSRLDDRYSESGEIVTHNGGKLACTLVGKGSEIIEIVKNHIDDVKRAIPKERLLIFESKDGWEPLCKFLGKEVPNSPYPRSNQKENFHQWALGLVEQVV